VRREEYLRPIDAGEIKGTKYQDVARAEANADVPIVKWTVIYNCDFGGISRLKALYH